MATLFYLWKGYAVILLVIAFWKECNFEKRSSRAHRLKSLYFIRPARQREKPFTILPHPQNQPKIKYIYSSDPDFIDSLEFSHYPTNHTKPGHRQQQSHPRQFNLSPQFTFQRQPTTFYHAHHFHPSDKIATLKRALLKPCDNPHSPLVIHRNQVEVPSTSTITPKPSASDLPDPPPIPPPKHVYSYDYYDYFVEPPPPPPPSWDPGWDPPPPAPAWGPPPPAPAWGPPPPPPPPPGWAAPPPAPAWGPPPPAPAWGPPPPTPAWGPPPGWAEEPEKPKKPIKSKYKPEKAKPPEEPPVYEYEPEPPKVIVKPAKSKSKTKVIKAKPVVLKEEKPKVVKEKVKEIKVKPVKEKVVKEKEWVEKDEDKKEKEKEKKEKGWFFKDTWNKLLDVFKFKDVYKSEKVKAVEVRGVNETEEESLVKANNMTVTTTTEASLLALALEAQKKGEMSTEDMAKKKKAGKRHGGKGSLPFSLSFDWPSTYLSFIDDSKEEEE